MKSSLLCAALLALFSAPGAIAGLLYDNTTTDTLDTVFFSSGPYTGLGDQIHLVESSPGAETAMLQMYNAGSAGTFDAELRLYQVGAPVGPEIGGTFTVSGVVSFGADVITMHFDLGGLAVPQDLIFVASVTNLSAGMDLGVNMFEPPTVGSSDNSFMIVDNGGFSTAGTANENVYFQLSDVPEPGTLALLGAGLVAGMWKRRRR